MSQFSMYNGPMNEFELIDRFFKRTIAPETAVRLGVGDDGAIVTPPENHELVMTLDTLNEGVHFFPDMPPEALGHRVLAVNLSDIAAMGAKPLWATLSLSLPQAEANWLRAFSKGFYDLADQCGVELIGGDTVKGPLSVSVQLTGAVPKGEGLLRSGAQVGDLVLVTGALGAAGIAIMQMKNKTEVDPHCLSRFYYPSARVLFGQALRNLAHAAIDISDGLIADLDHILKQSSAGARIELDRVPVDAKVFENIAQVNAHAFALNAGDDYELCFTLPAQHLEQVKALAMKYDVPCEVIGEIVAQEGITFHNDRGETIDIQEKGYSHFNERS